MNFDTEKKFFNGLLTVEETVSGFCVIRYRFVFLQVCDVGNIEPH